MPEGQEPTHTPDPSPEDVPSPNTPGNPAEPAAPSPAPETFDAEYVKKLRAESAKYRTRAQELERAQMSEAEKLKAERDEAVTGRESLERELRQERTRHAVETAAREAGILPDDAERLLVIEDGKDIKKAVADLAKAKPYLVQKHAESPTPANPGRGAATNGSFSRSQLKDQKFFAEHKADIMVAAREGRITDD